MILTVEYNPEQDSIEINFDTDGLDLLIQRLRLLKENTANGAHDHLMTSSWGGWELTENKQGKDNILKNHLQITLLPPDL